MADLRGGKREGAGRKPSGKSKIQFWVTVEEAAELEKRLQEIRNPKKPFYVSEEEDNDNE